MFILLHELWLNQPGMLSVAKQTNKQASKPNSLLRRGRILFAGLAHNDRLKADNLR